METNDMMPTLRDRFAMAALQGMLSLATNLNNTMEYEPHFDIRTDGADNTVERQIVAETAYAMADAMLAAREVK